MKIKATNNMKNWEVFFTAFTLNLTISQIKEEKNHYKITFKLKDKIIEIKTYNLDLCLNSIERFGNEYIKKGGKIE